MDLDSVIVKLKHEATQDDAVRDVFKGLSKRLRTRSILNVRSIAQDMREFRTVHGIDDYSRVLTLMASLGIGKPKKEKGRIVELTDISIDLKSLGANVIGDSKSIKAFKARTNFTSVPDAVRAITEDPDSVKIYPMRKSASVSVTITVNGKEMIVPIPSDFTADEIKAVIDAFSVIKFPNKK